MYSCVKIWHKKYMFTQQAEIDAIDQQSRTRISRQAKLDEYISKVKKDGDMFPERAWDTVSELACPKVEIDIDDVGVG